MTAPILSLSAIALMTLSAITLVGGRSLRRNIRLLGFFLMVYLVDNLVLLVVNSNPTLQIIPNHVWEGTLICYWSGKLYSILLSLGLVLLSRKVIIREEVGLVLKQRRGSFLPALLSLCILAVVWTLLARSWLPRGRMDIEALLYLALMPGMNEELVYRGLLPGLLNKIFPRQWVILGARLGWGAVITSLLFGLLHGYWIDSGYVMHINLFVIILNSMTGLVYAWQRELSGSLLMPILSHGMVDFSIFFFRMA